MRIEHKTKRNIVCTASIPFPTLIARFRELVPPLDVQAYRKQSTGNGIRQVIQNANSSTGFVLFTEFNHSRWMTLLAVSDKSNKEAISGHDEKLDSTTAQQIRGLHRFVFGNPLLAMDILRLDPTAGLNVPIDCCFTELHDGSTHLAIASPIELYATDDKRMQNAGFRDAIQALEERLQQLLHTLLCTDQQG